MLALIIPTAASSQNQVSTPYSKYGLGKVDLFDNAINNAMGGVGYALSNNYHINPLNPASYAGIDTTSLVFDMGFYAEWGRLSSKDNRSKNNSASLSHITIGFPVHRTTKIVLGLLPMSNINYTSSETIVDTNLGTHKKEYAGDGGISKGLLGVAFSPIKNLSIGANLEYLFGNYYKSSSVLFPDSLYMYSARRETNYHINAFNYNFGIQYFYTLKNEDRIGLGAVYNPNVKLKTDNMYSHYTFTSSGGLEYIKDSIHETSDKGNILYPQSFGIGLSYEKKNSFLIGLDGSYANWSEFYLQPDIPNQYLTDEYRLGLGGEWRPNPYGNYMQKLAYRGGIRYSTGMLEIFDTRIKEFGIGFGIGMPIKKTNTMINLSMEYFTKGSTSNGLIREDYFRIGLSLSTKDTWFFKRKYQ